MSKLFCILVLFLVVSSLLGCDAKFNTPTVAPFIDSTVVCESCVEIKISTPNIADGVTPTYADLSIYDVEMRPLADYAPTLTFDGNGADQTNSWCNRTDQDGRSRCKITTPIPGERGLRLRGWQKRTSITFFRPLPLKGLHQIGAGAAFRAGTRSTLSLGAQANPIVSKDNQNNLRARFSHLGGSF